MSDYKLNVDADRTAVLVLHCNPAWCAVTMRRWCTVNQCAVTDCPVLVTKAVPAQLQVRSNVSDPNGFEWDLMDSTLVYDADEDQWHLEYHGRTGSFKRVDEAEATNAALSPDHR